MAILTREHLIDKVKERAEGINNKVVAKSAVEVMFEEIRNAVENGDEVRIYNFGTFTTKEKAEREGFNPRTGEKIHIPTKKFVKFKPTPEFKNGVNKN